MKSVLVNISFAFFPSLVFGQVNSDAAKIKKEGLREIRFYQDKTDSFPSKAMYYDSEGRVRKCFRIDFITTEPSLLRHAYIEEFDSLGRKTKVIFSCFVEKNLDEAKMINDDKGTRTYFYDGDSVRIEIDSTWRKKQFVHLQITKRIVHWKKTPAPTPRPILWQDSIESVFKEIIKIYKFHYRDISSPLPENIDSSVSVFSVSYSIENNKLIGREHYESNKEGDDIINGDLIKTYTLNQKYDTVTWISNSKENLNRNGYPNTSVFGNYVFVRVLETKRSGDKYIIHFDETSSGDWKVCEECLNQDVKSKEPWSDYMITHYYADGYEYEQPLEVETAKHYFGGMEKIRY